MGREFEEERVFSEQIDRLMAGEDVRKDLELSDDCRSALDFARTMIDLRVSPAPQFASGLKAGLLQELAAKEDKQAAGRGWFWRLMPSSPLFQAIAGLAVVFIIGGIIWATMFRPSPVNIVREPGLTPPATWGPITASPTPTSIPIVAATTVAATTTAATKPAPTYAPAPTTAAPATPAPSQANVYLSAAGSSDKLSYLPGETITLQLRLKNITSQPVVMQNFPPVISLMQADTKQPVYTFGAGTLARTINPGQSEYYSFSWDQTDEKGRHVAPGRYYLELEEVYHQGLSVPLNLTSPVSFEILPASSAASGMERTLLSLDYPLAVNGITVTLQQIKIDEGGAVVTAFISPPPDYVLKEGPGGLYTTVDYRISARYSLGGSWFEKSGPSFAEYYAGGMKHTWSLPLTNPNKSGDLILVIDNIAGWSGPWEFHISLN